MSNGTDRIRLVSSGGASTSGSDGGGPEDPMLEQRVGDLEKRVERIETKLDRLAEGVHDLKHAIAELAASLKLCATKDELFGLHKDVAKLREDTAEIKGRMVGLSDRFNHIPSTWQMITFMLGSQIAFAGILFTALKFGLK